MALTVPNASHQRQTASVASGLSGCMRLLCGKLMAMFFLFYFFAAKNDPPSGPVRSLCSVPAGFSHTSPALKIFVPFSVVIVNSPQAIVG